MILDHFIMTMVAMLFAIPMMISIFSEAFTISHEQNEMDFGGPFLYVALLGFALYFCKDIINGQSIGKRITKVQVVDNNTGLVASPMKCLLRNVFCVIWPLEVLMTLINPGRRLGDLLAGTRIVPFTSSKTSGPNFDLTKALPPIVVAYGLMLLISLPI
ncbi:RDD family protein [Hymenobacter sp. BT18]|nr:RDD family protein [Hymenobacter sp. BT18]